MRSDLFPVSSYMSTKNNIKPYRTIGISKDLKLLLLYQAKSSSEPQQKVLMLAFLKYV